MTNDCKTCPVSTGTHNPAEAVHQIDEQQAEALRLADDCEESATHWVHEIDTRAKAAKMLRAQHARIAELEAEATDNARIIGASAETELALRARVEELERELVAVGAGGVEPLRTPVAAPQAVQATVPDVELLRNVITRAISSKTSHHINTAKATFTRDSNNGTALGELVDAIAGDLMAHFPAASAHPAEAVPAPAAVAVADERAAFEAWAKSENMNIGSDCDGYIHADTAVASMAWQARAALAATQPAAQGMDAIRALIAQHSNELERNHYAYFELAYTRRTGWMVWITDKPAFRESVLVNPDRKVLASGQGDTPEAACAAALAAQAKQGGA